MSERLRVVSTTDNVTVLIRGTYMHPIRAGGHIVRTEDGDVWVPASAEITVALPLWDVGGGPHAFLAGPDGGRYCEHRSPRSGLPCNSYGPDPVHAVTE